MNLRRPRGLSPGLRHVWLNHQHVINYLIFIDLQRNCFHKLILGTQGRSKWINLTLGYPHCQEFVLGQAVLPALLGENSGSCLLPPGPLFSNYPPFPHPTNFPPNF